MFSSVSYASDLLKIQEIYLPYMDPIWPNPKYFTNPDFPEIRDFPSKNATFWGPRWCEVAIILTKCYGIQNGNNLGSNFFHLPSLQRSWGVCTSPMFSPKVSGYCGLLFSPLEGRSLIAHRCTCVCLYTYLWVCVHWRHSLSLSPQVT